MTVANYGLGDDFMAFGYPESIFKPRAQVRFLEGALLATLSGSSSYCSSGSSTSMSA
jgi:hypothetical protein